MSVHLVIELVIELCVFLVGYEFIILANHFLYRFFIGIESADGHTRIDDTTDSG